MGGPIRQCMLDIRTSNFTTFTWNERFRFRTVEFRASSQEILLIR